MTMTEQNIFNNVPKKDHLALFKQGEADYSRVIELLNFKKEDVANATHTPKASVRYDHKIPKELAERICEWAVALGLVAQYFRGDLEKTVLWFKTPNYLLGNVAPRDMIRFGRFNKLFEFIQSALAENRKS